MKNAAAAQPAIEYIEVTDDEAALIERAAALDGEEPEAWFQRVVVEAARSRVSGRRK